MKNTFLIFAFAVLFFACSKSTAEEEPKPSNTNSKVTGTMKGTVDGKTWTAKVVSFGGLSALVDITGKVDDENTISLQFIDTNLELNKTYQLNLNEENLSGNIIVRNNNNLLISKSGKFKITKYTKNKNIEGEFEGEFSDYINKNASLKNFTFNMKY
jgi:PBP1b-binding outer membrane lipoprotein LpoB